MKQYKALVIGTTEYLILPLPKLLSRAHFSVDCITTSKVIKASHAFNVFLYEKNVQSLLKSSAMAIKSNDYDLIVIADDRTIKYILESALPIEDKIKLLPVLNKKIFLHLYSKIGLAEVFQRHHILQPDFSIVHDKSELKACVNHMGYPLVLKGDQSGAGLQTVFCRNKHELNAILSTFHFFPAILQRKIEGDLIGIDAFFQASRLVYFSYAIPLVHMHHLETTPTILRRYVVKASLDKKLLEELKGIGRALGAHGFVNISCIYSPTHQKRYYFEADMRPTAWVDHPKYFLDDPAQKIRAYFQHGTYLRALDKNQSHQSNVIDLPLFLRMKFWEILINRYHVWTYIHFDKIIYHIYLRRMRHALLALLNMRALRKWISSIVIKN